MEMEQYSRPPTAYSRKILFLIATLIMQYYMKLLNTVSLEILVIEKRNTFFLSDYNFRFSNYKNYKFCNKKKYYGKILGNPACATRLLFLYYIYPFALYPAASCTVRRQTELYETGFAGAGRINIIPAGRRAHSRLLSSLLRFN